MKGSAHGEVTVRTFVTTRITDRDECSDRASTCHFGGVRETGYGIAWHRAPLLENPGGGQCPSFQGAVFSVRLLERYGLVRMTNGKRAGRRRVRVPHAAFDQIELKIAI